MPWTRARGGLRLYFSEVGKPQAFEQSTEVRNAQGDARALDPQAAGLAEVELKRRCGQLEQENYELAAILRDD